MAKHRGGCPHAEGDILTQMLPIVERIAMKYRFGNSFDSDDLISDGMLAVMRAIREDTGKNSASFKTFASVCARNAMISRLRKKSVRAEGGVDFWDMIPDEKKSIEPPDNIDDLAEFSEVASIAAQAAKDLPEEQQQVILLLTQGVLPDDIADRLGFTPAELKERLNRVVAFLSFEIQMEAPEQAARLARYCNAGGSPEKPLLRLMRGS